MKTDFKKKWEDVVKEKGNTIIAGCDPLVEDENGDFVVRNGESLRNWCMKFIEEVGPRVAGIKCNPSDFQSEEGMAVLKEISKYCKERKIISILDYKISDVGHTNKKYVNATKERGFDFVTTAPYAGNATQVLEFCKKLNVGSCNMGLMSNPEFMRESTYIDPSTGNELWKDRLEESLKAGTDCLVLGGTYNTEDIYFQEFLKRVKDENVLFLVPGLGAQGGNIETFLESLVRAGIDPRRAQLNFGRELMDLETKEAREKRVMELKLIYQKWVTEYGRLFPDERKRELNRPINKQ